MYYKELRMNFSVTQQFQINAKRKQEYSIYYYNFLFFFAIMETTKKESIDLFELVKPLGFDFESIFRETIRLKLYTYM